MSATFAPPNTYPVPAMREKYYDYNAYIKYKRGNDFYNRGLQFKTAGDEVWPFPTIIPVPEAVLLYRAASKCFQKALLQNPKDPDFLVQFQILKHFASNPGCPDL